MGEWRYSWGAGKVFCPISVGRVQTLFWNALCLNIFCARVLFHCDMDHESVINETILLIFSVDFGLVHFHIQLALLAAVISFPRRCRQFFSEASLIRTIIFQFFFRVCLLSLPFPSFNFSLVSCCLQIWLLRMLVVTWSQFPICWLRPFIRGEWLLMTKMGILIWSTSFVENTNNLIAYQVAVNCSMQYGTRHFLSSLLQHGV